MGTFRHPLTLHSAKNEHSETIDALVDTGSTFTAVPGRILRSLGVEPHRTLPLRLADGRVGRRPIGRVLADIDGQREEILCVFAEDGDLATIGAHALEAFLLGVDPVERRLVPAEALWADVLLTLQRQ